MAEDFERPSQLFRLKLFRTVCLLAALLYPVYWYGRTLLPNGDYDPLWMRLVLDVCFAAALAASFLWRETVIKLQEPLWVGLGFLMNTHMLVLMFANELSFLYTACTFSIIACFTGLINERPYAIAFAVGMFCLSFVGFVFQPLGTVLLVASLIAAVCTVTTLGAEWRRRTVVALRGATQSLRESEERYRVISETTPDAIYTIDQNARILFANAAIERVFGYTVGELVGESSLILFATDDRERHAEGFAAHVKSGDRGSPWLDLPLRGLRKDGQEIPLELSCSEATYAGRRVFISIVRDVRERLRAEEEREQLRARVAVSGQLAALGEMAGGIAHEINNPLTIIDGRVRMLEHALSKTPLDVAAAREINHRIGETSARIARIVRGMRTLSRRGDADSFTLVDLEAVVQDATALCLESLRGRGIELRVDAPAGVTMAGRPGQITQIVLNLLSNASDAVSQLDDRWIRVDVEDRAETVGIAVTDSGRGVPPPLQDKVFQPFFTTKPIGKGTGLGLSISRALVEAHYGRIEIDRACPHTRFIVTLPKDPHCEMQ